MFNGEVPLNLWADIKFKLYKVLSAPLAQPAHCS